MRHRSRLLRIACKQCLLWHHLNVLLLAVHQQFPISISSCSSFITIFNQSSSRLQTQPVLQLILMRLSSEGSVFPLTHRHQFLLSTPLLSVVQKFSLRLFAFLGVTSVHVDVKQLLWTCETLSRSLMFATAFELPTCACPGRVTLDSTSLWFKWSTDWCDNAVSWWSVVSCVNLETLFCK